MSQLVLATEAGVSSKHISFIETGRSRPGARLILKLAEALDIPPRECNALLESAGLRPAYREVNLANEEMSPYQRIIQRLLKNHEPYPAYVLDRWWNVVDGNRAAKAYLPDGTGFGFNVIERFLECPRTDIQDWCDAAWGLFARVRKAWVQTGHDEVLGNYVKRFEAELKGCPNPSDAAAIYAPEVFSKTRVGDATISIVSTLVQFETAHDVTLNELRVELIFPADDDSETMMCSLFDELSGHA